MWNSSRYMQLGELKKCRRYWYCIGLRNLLILYEHPIGWIAKFVEWYCNQLIILCHRDIFRIIEFDPDCITLISYNFLFTYISSWSPYPTTLRFPFALSWQWNQTTIIGPHWSILFFIILWISPSFVKSKIRCPLETSYPAMVLVIVWLHILLVQVTIIVKRQKKYLGNDECGPLNWLELNTNSMYNLFAIEWMPYPEIVNFMLSII